MLYRLIPADFEPLPGVADASDTAGKAIDKKLACEDRPSRLHFIEGEGQACRCGPTS
jgi:hypothetical protein